MCLDCLGLKFSNFKVCSLNLTIKNLQIVNFIIIIKNPTQVINKFSKIRQKKNILIHAKTIHALW